MGDWRYFVTFPTKIVSRGVGMLPTLARSGAAPGFSLFPAPSKP